MDVDLLDRLMNLVGELVLTRNQVSQTNGARDDPPLNAVSQRVNLFTSELQESVMKTRMQPIGVVWNKLPRVVRDLATGLGKDIALQMGAGTELDRAILDASKIRRSTWSATLATRMRVTGWRRSRTGSPAT